MQSLLLRTGAANVVSILVLCTLLTAAAVTDVRTRRIPNQLVLVIAIGGLAASAFGLAANGIARSGGAILVGFAIWFPLFAIGALGAGDVKLFAAAAAWLGPERALVAALISALLGGLLALVWLIRVDGVTGAAARLAGGWVATRHIGVDPRSRHAVPYGVALAAGAACVAWYPHALTLVG